MCDRLTTVLREKKKRGERIDTDAVKQAFMEIVPESWLTDRALRLFMIQNLAWQYVESLLDYSALVRYPDTKRLCREIKTLKREYEHFRYGHIGCARGMADESERAGAFEDIIGEDIKKWSWANANELGRLHLGEEDRLMVEGTHAAMTIIEATLTFARKCDRELEEMGVPAPDCSLVQKEFLSLPALVPRFIGDRWKPSDADTLSAGIISNRLLSIEFKTIADRVY